MKLIKLSETHYVIIDDSEIKENCWILTEAGIVCQVIELGDGLENDKKITHSTKPLEGVTTLNLSEVEEFVYGYSVEKMAEQFVIEKVKMSSQIAGLMVGYIEGFKAHQELSKDKLFTEHDMVELANYIVNNALTCNNIDKIQTYINNKLPKTEWEVEFDEQGKLKLV